MFKCGPVYYANHNAKEDIIINQGGTDSGKTYAIIQNLFTKAIIDRPPTQDPIITVVGESIPNLKKGAYRTAKDIFRSTNRLSDYIKDWNETDRTIYFKSGWIMEFTSYETEQQAKQGKRQYLFVNEAQAISWPIFWQLAKRTRVRTFIDYNPTARFWSHDNLIGTGPSTNELTSTVKLIISDHRHNPFLSDKDHAKTEGIKDHELFKVYARGLTGNISGIIFPDWQKIPDDQFPKDAPFFGGLDFGYTNDPTAGIKIARVGETIFLHEICYTPGTAPIQIKQLFTAAGFTSSTPIYCEHDPDNIAQLRRLSMLALPARKGQGSINAGIVKMKEYKVRYTASSVNIDEERRRYTWIANPDTGKSTNTPIDQWNHCMDAARYGIYTHYFSGR